MAEPYHGDMMHHCPLKPFDFRHCCAVVVSGDGINFCGHTLLHTGGGWYFHVAGFHSVPKFMREDGYLRYLKENGKHEIRRWIIKIPNPVGAHRKLEELLATQWLWAVLPHNCAAFVEDVVQLAAVRPGCISTALQWSLSHHDTHVHFAWCRLLGGRTCLSGNICFCAGDVC